MSYDTQEMSEIRVSKKQNRSDRSYRDTLKVSKLLGPSSVTETTSTSSELLEGEGSVRGMLDQLNSGMFLNCNVSVNFNCKE